MKLSKETLAIIKNFSNINGNLSIKAGNKLSTVTAARNILAEAVIAEEFPCDFGIYDLSEFLGALSLFESPDLEFSSQYVNIVENNNGVRYYAAAASALTTVPPIKAFPTPDVEFDMTGQMLSHIQRVSSILRVADFSVIGDGSDITISVGDKTNPTGNVFTSKLGVTDKEFKVNFKVENIKMMPGDYRVSIGAKKIARFQATNTQLTYYVAIELDSTFGF